jgi:hypothetical protein
MQSELTGAFKAKAGHGYSYADLAQCIKTAQKPLANNGLSVVQLLHETERGTELETILTHELGGYISSSWLMAKAALSGGSAKNPAQLMGASVTYCRRYSYAAIIGLAQTDDDASQYDELIDLAVEKGYTVPQLLSAFSVTKINQIKDIQSAFNSVLSWANTTKPTEQ